jgi:hypothetical protein
METQVMNVCDVRHEERIFDNFTVYEWTMKTCDWDGRLHPVEVKFRMFRDHKHALVWHPNTKRDLRTPEQTDEEKVYANEPSTL